MYEGFFDTIALGHLVVAIVVIVSGVALYILAMRDLNRFRRRSGDPEGRRPKARNSLEDVLRDVKALSQGRS